MFLKTYALQNNPFAGVRERPFVESVAARKVATKLQRAAARRLHCLVISGPAGAGKSTAVRQGLHHFEGWFSSWVDHPTTRVGGFLRGLLTDLGLGEIEGDAAELRNILEVFLRHQAARRRHLLLVVDDLDGASAQVIDVLHWLAGLRLRGQPLVCLVMITRGDALASRLLAGADRQVGEMHQHQKFHGFAPEETRAYLLACLDEAGCNDSQHLINDVAVAQIQGFSRGIPGLIDRLCAAAFESLAERVAAGEPSPPLCEALISSAAQRLGFRFDKRALAGRKEPLSREHIREHKQDQLRIDAARLLVASGGQLIAEVSLNRSRIVLGRDANCDISLDSRYVSRYQNLFLQTDAGWLMIDLNSTNGSFVNGRKVREHVLRDGDVIAVGNHQLRFFSAAARPGDRRFTGTAIGPRPAVVLAAEDPEQATGS